MNTAQTQAQAPHTPAPQAPADADIHTAWRPNMDASSESFRQLNVQALGSQQREILHIVLAHQRNGGLDMTGMEISNAYEAWLGKRIDAGRVSARLAEMVGAIPAPLQRRADARACSITGRQAHPVFVTAAQARLFA